MNKLTEFLKNNQFALITAFIYISSIGIILYFNPFDIITNYSTLLFPIICIVGLSNLFLYITYKFNNRKNIGKIVSYLIGILLAFVLIIICIYYLIIWFPYILLSILSIICLVGLLALVYLYIIKPYLDDIDKAAQRGRDILKDSIPIAIIFYIPCLFLDLIDYIKKQYNITSSTTLIIVLIEIFVILTAVLIPYLIREYGAHDAKVLLKNPVYLNKETPLGVFQDVNKKKDNSKKFPYKYNYGLSSWIWINPQPGATSEAYSVSTPLLNYGNIIKIKFNKNKIEILAASSSSKKKSNTHDLNNKLIKIYETSDFSYQKWNNIVLNYSGGTLDVFINDKLVCSKGNISPIFHFNKVTAGYPDGIHGGIKNVAYYDYKLSRFKVHSIYNFI